MSAKPPIPPNEAERLAALRDLFVLDSEPEPLFDAITRLASEICRVPIALVSLVDAERQWFKANVGLPGVNETPRDVAFCAHAITDDAVLEVPDATRDARFAGNPLVTGAPDIRFYAGAPLVLPGGERVGTLCVIDRQARRLDAAQVSTLRSLAAMASQALVMRRDLIAKSLAVRSEYEQALAASEARYRAIVEEQSELISLARADGELVYVNPAYARHFGRVPAGMVGANLFDFVEPEDRDAVRALAAGVLQTGQSSAGENRMVSADGVEKWVAWSNSLQRDALRRPLLHSVGRDITDRILAERALSASQDFLVRTGRVAGVGGWELDLASSVLKWSDETRRIYEVGPDYVPTVDSAIAFCAPEAPAHRGRGAGRNATRYPLGPGAAFRDRYRPPDLGTRRGGGGVRQRQAAAPGGRVPGHHPAQATGAAAGRAGAFRASRYRQPAGAHCVCGQQSALPLREPGLLRAFRIGA